jgi:hypothetical protein
VGSTDRLEIHGRVLAAPIDLKFEGEAIALIEGRKARTFDGRNVYESIGLAVIALDEAETLHCVEKLDRALRLFAGQLALRPTLGALDGHRLAFDSKVGCRDLAATIDKRELKRLSVREVGQACLLDGRDVNEHVVPAIVANNEAESLLRIEELHNALSFADDLGRHAPASAEAAAATTTAAAAEAAAVAAVAATEAAAAIAKASASAAKAAAILESAAFTVTVFPEEPVALVPSATAAVASTPSVETHTG